MMTVTTLRQVWVDGAADVGLPVQLPAGLPRQPVAAGAAPHQRGQALRQHHRHHRLHSLRRGSVDITSVLWDTWRVKLFDSDIVKEDDNGIFKEEASCYY